MSTELTCQGINSILSEYIDGLLDAETAESARQHLQECDICKKEYEALDKMVFLLRNIPESSVPAGFNYKLKAALRKEQTVKSWRRMRTRLQFGAMAAVFTVGLFSFWVYSNMDTDNLVDKYMVRTDLSNAVASESAAPRAAGGMDDEFLTFVNGSDAAMATEKPTETGMRKELTTGSDGEWANESESSQAKGRAFSLSDMDYSIASQNAGHENGIDSYSYSPEARGIADKSVTAASDSASGRPPAIPQTQQSSKEVLASGAASIQLPILPNTKPRVLIPEITLVEMLSRLPEKANNASDSGGVSSDGLLAEDTESLGGRSASDAGIRSIQEAQNTQNNTTGDMNDSARQKAAVPDIAEESSPSAQQSGSSPTGSAVGPSRSAATAGGAASRSTDNSGVLARHEKVISEKLSGCEYRVLYMETEGNKYVYRVRLITNMYGAVIDMEMDFVFDSTGVAIYYADKPDTII